MQQLLLKHWHVLGAVTLRGTMTDIHKDIYIRVSVDALCRDDTSEISRDTGTERPQTRRESLARPSEHTNNNF